MELLSQVDSLEEAVAQLDAQITELRAPMSCSLPPFCHTARETNKLSMPEMCSFLYIH